MLEFLQVGSRLLAAGEEAGHATDEHTSGHSTSTTHAAEGDHKGDHKGDHGLSFTGLGVYLAIVLAILFAWTVSMRKGLNGRFFTKWTTQWTEHMYVFVENMAVGIIGARGRRYMPFLVTLWLIIFIGNIVSLFFPSSVTGDLSFNLAMALIVVGYVQWEGIKQNGLFGHIAHFAGPKLPLALAVLITPMIFIVELLSETMKNVSLSLRLYGNIDGGHKAVVAMNDLGKHIANIGGFDVNIPIGMFLMPIKLLTCIVQAMIFTLLFCVYVSMVTHDEHHGDEHGHDHGHDHGNDHGHGRHGHG